MIITISGLPGSGKSTVSRLVASKLNLSHYSAGEFMRKEAEDRNISLMELSKIAEKDRSIDEETDQWQIKLGREKNNLVIDTRLGFHFIPNSIKIFLKADIKERARRIYADKIRQENNTEENVLKKLKQREESEKKRYKEYYSLDYTDESNYDLVIDTTSISAEEAAEKIIEFVKKKQ